MGRYVATFRPPTSSSACPCTSRLLWPCLLTGALTTQNGIDDPHVASSLFKLFLRELSDPLVPSSLYNDALSSSKSPEDAIAFVQRLPICHRRVLVFVISFLQLFMEERVVEQTKMTPSNLGE
jgi:hypothetical protein